MKKINTPVTNPYSSLGRSEKHANIPRIFPTTPVGAVAEREDQLEAGGQASTNCPVVPKTDWIATPTLDLT